MGHVLVGLSPTAPFYYSHPDRRHDGLGLPARSLRNEGALAVGLHNVVTCLGLSPPFIIIAHELPVKAGLN